MKIMHESLKSFLAAKGLITAAQAEMPGFPPVVELAYKSWAQHRCGIQPPIDVPINLEQVPVRILDDADWRWLDTVEDEALESEEINEEVEDDGSEIDGEESRLDTPPVPASTVLPVAEPVTTPTMETGESVQAAAPAAPVADAGAPLVDQVSELANAAAKDLADAIEKQTDEDMANAQEKGFEEEDDEEGTEEGESDEDGDDLDGAGDETDDVDKE